MKSQWEDDTTWGIEFATTESFFFVPRKVCVVKGQAGRLPSTVKQGDGFELRHYEEEVGHRGELTRHIHIEATRPLLLQDFVLRYTFDSKIFPDAIIDGRRISHRNTNVWYQHPVSRVEIVSNTSHVLIRSDSVHVQGWRLDHYVRDEPSGKWVVHARLMPPADRKWLHWDTRFGRVINFKLPKRLQGLIPERIEDHLLYRAEKRGGRPNWQLNYLGLLKPGQQLSITSTATMNQSEAYTSPSKVRDSEA